jgi:hypothetical protein
MRRIFIFREGNMMAAMIGPDLVIGVAGFGETIREAMRDLADQFDRNNYLLSENAVMVFVAGKTASATGQTPADAIRKLGWIIAERKYTEQDFPDLDWIVIAAEPPVVAQY